MKDNLIVYYWYPEKWNGKRNGNNVFTS